MAIFSLHDFQILSTGADGGHYYISAKINFEGEQRVLVVFFEDKADEEKLNILKLLSVEGELLNQGIQQSLILLHAKIIDDKQ